MTKPAVDFTLTVHKRDDDGYYLITGSVPGLLLCGKSLNYLMLDVPLAVNALRELNGDERQSDKPTGTP